MGAGAAQLFTGGAAYLCLLVRAQRLPFGQGQAIGIAADSHTDRPATGVQAFGNSDAGVVHLDHGRGWPDAQVGKAAVHHQGAGAACSQVAGADDIVRRITSTSGDGFEHIHDRAVVARGAADLDAIEPQPVDHLQRTGDEAGKVTHYAGVHRREHLVEMVDITVGDRLAIAFFPLRCHLGQLAERCNMVPFGRTHRAPGLGNADLDPEIPEQLHKGAHRGA